MWQLWFWMKKISLKHPHSTAGPVEPQHLTMWLVVWINIDHFLIPLPGTTSWYHFLVPLPRICLFELCKVTGPDPAQCWILATCWNLYSLLNHFEDDILRIKISQTHTWQRLWVNEWFYFHKHHNIHLQYNICIHGKIYSSDNLYTNILKNQQTTENSCYTDAW